VRWDAIRCAERCYCVAEDGEEDAVELLVRSDVSRPLSERLLRAGWWEVSVSDGGELM
jgi:hypothetical protein